MTQSRIDTANQKVIDTIQTSVVELFDVDIAKNRLAFLQGGKALLHSGPPVAWRDMCSAMRSAACGAAVLEGWASTVEEAARLAESGEIRFDSNNDHAAVGPMAGIISPSMPVFCFRNTTYGNEAFVTMNEGLGKALRFGANDITVITRLHWIAEVLAPILKNALELSGPVDITDMIARGVQRGDECHNRNKASTSLFIRHIAPAMVRTKLPREEVAKALEFLDGNDHFFLNLSMGNSKATMDAIGQVPDSTIVSCMCTNGHEFGLRVAGLGKQWITAPSPYATGNYFQGFTAEDASPTMGDSYISEAAGIGAFGMGCAPGIGRFIGISAQQTVNYSLEMYAITVVEHRRFKIPCLNYRGTPLGIDVRKVLETGILPIINTGIAHKLPGIGQIGAGVVRAPMACFERAKESLGL